MNLQKIWIITALAILQVSLAMTAFAQDGESDGSTYTKLIENNFPSTLKSTKKYDGSALTLENGGLSYIYHTAVLDRHQKFLVVLYQAWTSTSTTVCILSVLSNNSNATSQAGKTVLNFPNELNNCTDLTLKDLGSDNTPDVLVTTSDERGHSLAPYIFRWNGNGLIDITPIIILDGHSVTAFRNLNISDVRINNSLLLLDLPDPRFTYDSTSKTYLLEGGKITLTGTYDYLQLLEQKTFQKPTATILRPSFSSAGTYTLDVKNLSSHNRAVRAEVTVNGNVVLKPQDFCSSPQPSKSDKDKWKGNDDDDDKDEDHCKRCVPKQEVDAVVNLSTTNTIKVKIYGRQDSKLELTLVKKP